MSNRRRLIWRACAMVVVAGWFVIGVMHFADGAWVFGLLSVLIAVGSAIAFSSPRRVRSRDARQLIGRCAAIGAGSLGLVGGIVGLVIGLHANTQTAWFAVFELGIPAAIVGGFSGLWIGVLLSLGRRLDRQAPVFQVRQNIDH